LRICGATTKLHLLPKYVSGRVVLRNIAYETMLQGFNASFLKEAKKTIFISFNLSLGHHLLNDPKHD
jgi:hypothetical protein